MQGGMLKLLKQAGYTQQYTFVTLLDFEHYATVMNAVQPVPKQITSTTTF